MKIKKLLLFCMMLLALSSVSIAGNTLTVVKKNSTAPKLSDNYNIERIDENIAERDYYLSIEKISGKLELYCMSSQAVQIWHKGCPSPYIAIAEDGAGIAIATKDNNSGFLDLDQPAATTGFVWWNNAAKELTKVQGLNDVSFIRVTEGKILLRSLNGIHLYSTGGELLWNKHVDLLDMKAIPGSDLVMGRLLSEEAKMSQYQLMDLSSGKVLQEFKMHTDQLFDVIYQDADQQMICTYDQNAYQIAINSQGKPTRKIVLPEAQGRPFAAIPAKTGTHVYLLLLRPLRASYAQCYLVDYDLEKASYEEKVLGETSFKPNALPLFRTKNALHIMLEGVEFITNQK